MLTPKEAVSVLKQGKWYKYLPLSRNADAELVPLLDAIDTAVAVLREKDALENERRKYTCPMCSHEWWEDRDAPDYPNYCPGCGEEMRKEG